MQHIIAAVSSGCLESTWVWAGLYFRIASARIEWHLSHRGMPSGASMVCKVVLKRETIGIRPIRDIDAPLHTVTLGNEIWGEMVPLSEHQAVASFAELDRIVTNTWGSSTKRPLLAGLDRYVNKGYLRAVQRRLYVGYNVTLDVLTYHDYPLGSSNDGKRSETSHDTSSSGS